MKLAHMTSVDVEKYFEENDLVILSCGSIEGHGKHNPVGLDTLVPERILDYIEEKCDVMIAPIMPYGATDDLDRFPGTVDIGQEVMQKVMQSIADSLIRHGAKRFLVINGHGGNTNPLDRVSLNLHRRGYWMAVINWWSTAGEINKEWAGGHGDFQETAAVMAVDPKLVKKEYFEDEQLVNDLSEKLPTKGFDYVLFNNVGVRVFRDTKSYAKNGWIGKGHPKLATEEMGKEMLETTSQFIVDFIEVFKEIDLPR